jgi:hypothetical protein
MILSLWVWIEPPLAQGGKAKTFQKLEKKVLAFKNWASSSDTFGSTII